MLFIDEHTGEMFEAPYGTVKKAEKVVLEILHDQLDKYYHAIDKEPITFEEFMQRVLDLKM